MWGSAGGAGDHGSCDGTIPQLLSAPSFASSPKYYKMVQGEGMPLLQDPQHKGDLYIYFDIVFPKRLSPEVKTVLKTILMP